MTVYELNKEQLDELRGNYYWSDENTQFEYADEITDEFLFEQYGHIDFVNDDFFCSMDK